MSYADFDNPPKCNVCHRLCQGYDADRGYSCTYKDCPRNIDAEQRQLRYNESRRLHDKIQPLLKPFSSTLFSVGELMEIMDKYGDGFVLQNAARSLGLSIEETS